MVCVNDLNVHTNSNCNSDNIFIIDLIYVNYNGMNYVINYVGIIFIIYLLNTSLD